MLTDASRHDLLDELAESFALALRQGKSPRIEDYVAQHPELADEIRELFGIVATVEAIDTRSNGESAGAAQRSPQPPIKELGEYRILGELGRGGMGVVYEAEQKSLGRRVALKVMRGVGALADPTELARFEREAKAAARLNHPNIVPVHAVGELDGARYFAMQLIHGQGLDQIITELRSHEPESEYLKTSVFETPPGGHDRQGASSESIAKEGSSLSLRAEQTASGATLRRARSTFYASVARLGRQAADALHYAHGQGLIHRDVKPSNLLLDIYGQLWVSDFGLAKDTTENDLTHSGDVLGTPRFMAPERFRGWSDPRSDIYSLGLTLYELITLQPAFADRDRALLVKRITCDEPSKPSTFDRQLPRALETILLKAIDKEPAHRYQTAAEMAIDLQSFIDGKPIRARRISRREQVFLWCLRNPALAILTGSVLVLLATVLFGSTAAALVLADARRDAINHLQEEIRAKDQVTKKEELALQALYEARKQQARAERFSGRPGQRVESMAAIDKAAELVTRLELPDNQRLELRNEKAAAMQLIDLEKDTLWIAPNALTDPNVDWYFFPRPEKPGYCIHSMPDGSLIALLSIDGPVAPTDPVVSPNGQYLAARIARSDQTSELAVWDVARPNPIVSHVQLAASAAEPFDFSADSASIAVLSSSSNVKILSLPSGKRTHSIPTTKMEGLSFAPRSNRLMVFGNGRIEFIDLDTGEVSEEIRARTGLKRVGWSPDERLLAGVLRDSHAGENALHLWNTTTGEHREIAAHPDNVRSFDFHPRGDIVATWSWDGTTRLWSLADGRELIRLEAQMTNFSRDGRWLGLKRQTSIGRWNVRLPEALRQLGPIPAEMQSGLKKSIPTRTCVHPDNRLVIIGSEDGMWACDAETNRSVAAVNRPGDSCQFSPDGRQLFSSGVQGPYTYVQSVDRRETEEEVVYVIGPPLPLPIFNGAESVPESDEFGCRFYQNRLDEFFYYDMKNLLLLPFKGMRRNQNLTTVSRDGRWLAAAHWHTSDTHVWDLRDRKQAKSIPSTGSTSLAFSPDGQTLAVNEQGRCVFYETETWKVKHQTSSLVTGRLNVPATFSEDGSMVAVGTGNRRQARLLSTRDFSELATLTLPPNEQLGSLVFSPDGSKLIEHGMGDAHVNVWDLREIRESLGELDFKLPPLEGVASDQAKSMRVQFVQGDDPGWTSPASDMGRAASRPSVVPPGGVFREPQEVRLESRDESDVLRYQINRKTPDPVPSVYVQPLKLMEGPASVTAWVDDEARNTISATRAEFFIDSSALPLNKELWRVIDTAAEPRDGPSHWFVDHATVRQSSNIHAPHGRSQSYLLRRDGTLRIYQPATDFTDGEFRLQIRAGDNDAIGVAFRLQDEGHHYRFEMDRERNYQVLACVDGDDYSVLAHRADDFTIGQWYNLRIVLSGAQISVFVDGKKHLETTDYTFAQGTVGLFCRGNDAAEFRYICLSDQAGE